MIRSLLYFIFLFISLPVLAAPSSEDWSFWDKNNNQSLNIIDHNAWQELLDTYLVVKSDGNLFRYSKVSKNDDEKLDNYIHQLVSIDPRRYNKTEQKAYWVNLYNALTVDLILNKYPVDSITDISTLFAFGPWNKKITSVASQDLSLNDIEHRILRPLWNDKRIHYAVNCASLGCPDLADKAYTGANIDDLLEAQTKRFIQQKKGVSWIDDKLTLSRIYEWYSEDFGSSEDLMMHIKKYSSKEQRQKLNNYTDTIRYQYDWNLNESL